MTSTRVRTPEESQALHQFGSSIKVYQLQGNLTFATIEALVRNVVESCTSIDYLLLDLKRVLTLNESACRLLYQLLTKLSGLGKSVLFAHADHLPLLRRYMKVKLDQSYSQHFRVFEDHDRALEWCENQLLDSVLPGRLAERPVQFAEYELFQSLTEEEIAVIVPRLKRRRFQRTETIVNAGDEAAELFCLARGNVSVTVSLGSSATKRLGTFSAGMTFGEIAMIDHAPRSANIVADTDGECDLLSLEDFESLAKSNPSIKIKLLENLCLGFCRMLRKANRDIGVVE
jgi:glutaminase